MSFILDKNILLKDYTRLKETTNLLLRKGKYESAIKMIEFASELMYNYNVMLCDDEIEHQIQKIAREAICVDTIDLLVSPRSERIVFVEVAKLFKENIITIAKPSDSYRVFYELIFK